MRRTTIFIVRKEISLEQGEYAQRGRFQRMGRNGTLADRAYYGKTRDDRERQRRQPIWFAPKNEDGGLLLTNKGTVLIQQRGRAPPPDHLVDFGPERRGLLSVDLTVAHSHHQYKRKRNLRSKILYAKDHIGTFEL